MDEQLRNYLLDFGLPDEDYSGLIGFNKDGSPLYAPVMVWTPYEVSSDQSTPFAELMKKKGMKFIYPNFQVFPYESKE